MLNEDRDDQSGNHQDLDWEAFLYISGEMTVDDAAFFESRLADDQAVREAVARAMELTQVTALAAEHSHAWKTVSSHSNTWLRRLTWMSCGAAACLALIVVSYLAFPSVWNRNVNGLDLWARHGSLRMDSHELALAWASSRTDLAENDTVASEDASGMTSSGVTLIGANTTAVSATTAIAENSVEDAVSLEIETPSWMLLAVTGLSGESVSPEKGVE